MAFWERSGSEAKTASAHGGRQRLSPWVALWRNSRGVVAVEFALVALPLFILVLGVFEVGYDLFVQATLDRVVQETAQYVQTGSAAGSSGETSTAFVNGTVCPLVNGLLNCADITIALQHISYTTDANKVSHSTDYFHATAPTFGIASGPNSSICTGTQGELMLITAWYGGPTFLGGLIPGFTATGADGSSIVHLTTSSAGFVDEYFTDTLTQDGSC